MASATPPLTFSTSARPRSTSRTRSGTILSRPTTPLRPPSRTSLRASQSTPTAGGASLGPNDHPLNALEPAFSELSDSMADLEANFMHLSLLNESIARFNENFGAFLYGMNMSAFCVDFPEAPIGQSFARAAEKQPVHQLTGGYGGESSLFQSQPGGTSSHPHSGYDAGEATFLTTDTSFVENPPATVAKASKYSSNSSSSVSTPRGRGAPRAGLTNARSRGGSGAHTRTASGIGRGGPSARGGASNTGSRIGRGIARGRGVK